VFAVHVFHIALYYLCEAEQTFME